MRKCKYCGTESFIQSGNCPSCGGNMFFYYRPVSHESPNKSKAFEVAVLTVAISALFVLCLSLIDITSSFKSRTVNISTDKVSYPVHTANIIDTKSIISSSEAVTVVLSDTGLEKEDLKNLSVKYKCKDDENYYKISFKYCGDKHTYYISPISGDIIKIKHDKD